MPGEVRPLSPRLSDDLNADRQSILVKAARDAYRRKTVVICKDGVVCCKCLRVGAGYVDFWNRTSCRWKEQHVNVFECLVGNLLTVCPYILQSISRIIQRGRSTACRETESADYPYRL